MADFPCRGQDGFVEWTRSVALEAAARTVAAQDNGDWKVTLLVAKKYEGYLRTGDVGQ